MVSFNHRRIKALIQKPENLIVVQMRKGGMKPVINIKIMYMENSNMRN